jgi:hypothetical protein
MSELNLALLERALDLSIRICAKMHPRPDSPGCTRLDRLRAVPLAWCGRVTADAPSPNLGSPSTAERPRTARGGRRRRAPARPYGHPSRPPERLFARIPDTALSAALPGPCSVRREPPAPAPRRRRALGPCARRAGQRAAVGECLPGHMLGQHDLAVTPRAAVRTSPLVMCVANAASAGRLSSRAIALGVRSGGWGRAGLLSFGCDWPAAC